MGKLVVSEFVTLDGVMEDPGGAESTAHGGWAFRFDRGPEGDAFKLDEVMAADAMLLGRRTYEGFASVWPGRKDEAGFADKMNTMPKFVVSTTLQDPEWNNTEVIHAEEVGTLRNRRHGDILVAGSGQLVRFLMALDLVDEYRLMVYPVVLGGGRHLFDEGVAAADLQLVQSQPAAQCVILTYRPRRDAAAG